MSAINGVIMQYFHWYLASDETLWQEIASQAKDLATTGITALWLPSTYLEALVQKGLTCTEQEYLSAIKTAQKVGLRVYGNLVLNHLQEKDKPPKGLDLSNTELQEKLKAWGEWYFTNTKIDGMGIEPAEQTDISWLNGWLDFIHSLSLSDRKMFVMGQYWSEDVNELHRYIINTEGRMSLLDVPLHYNFYRASKSGEHYDLRQIFAHTLVQEQSSLAVTFVENHTSQPLSPLESPVEAWFKPLAYALILLRRAGYPCIFYGDYYGAYYRERGQDGQEYEVWLNDHQWIINKLLDVRQHYAYGDQYDYFDDPHLIGWTRLGDEQHPGAIAVVLSNGWGGKKWMEVGKPNTTFYDVTEHMADTVTTNEYGWGEFACRGGSVSIWVNK